MEVTNADVSRTFVKLVNSLKDVAFVTSAKGLTVPDVLKHVIDGISDGNGLLADLNKLVLAGDKLTGCTLDILPMEIQIKIFKFALLADGGEIRLPCVTGRGFKPNVAVALLRVSRSMYHLCRDYLYTENIFIFDHFASELQYVNKSLGLSTCRLRGCACFAHNPWIQELHLEVGDEHNPYMGPILAGYLHESLITAKTNVHVGKLLIRFRKFSISFPEQFECLIHAFQKIKVGRVLEIVGNMSLYNNMYFKHDLYNLVRAMDMKETHEPGSIIPATMEDVNGGVALNSLFSLKFKSLYDERDFL